MTDQQDQTKRPRGRPATRRWPDPIPASPEDVARAIMAGPPKPAGEWRYLREHREETGARKERRAPAVAESAGG